MPGGSPQAVVREEEWRDDPPSALGGLLEDEAVVQRISGVAVEEEHVMAPPSGAPRGGLNHRDRHGLASNSLLDLGRGRTHQR